MSSDNTTLRIVFGGGWATDLGNIAEVEISQQGLVRVPFLLESLNNYYELDGGTHKIGGTERMHDTAAASGAEIIGLFDYWRQGSGGSPAQKIVIHAGTVVQQATIDTDFANITTGLVDDAVPCYTTFDDWLIMSTASSDAPQKWNQSGNTTALHASAPNFAISEAHKNRLWAAGVNATPSRLFYSAFVDPEDWTGAGSGFIDIDPNDGDSITALASHKNDLWVFKGPYKRSIHRITGSAPTGGDSFARQTFVRGISAVSHNTIFRFRDDLGFMEPDGSVHSLAATAAFGDFNETALSQPINTWLQDHINGSRLDHAWAAVDSIRGYVLFTIPIDTSTPNNHHLLMDYRFNPPRWAHWDAFASGAVAFVISTGLPALFDGSNAGYVRRLQRSSRNIDSLTEIQSKMAMPFLHFGNMHKEKRLERASLGLSPKGNSDVTLKWTRDGLTEQSQTAAQGATGTQLGAFVLGTSVLGGSTFLDLFMSLHEGGKFRALKLGAENLNLDEDLELHSISATIKLGADSGVN